MQSTEPLPTSQPLAPSETLTPIESTPTGDGPYVTVKHTATVFGTSREVIYRLFHAGRLPGRRIGRDYKILREFVESFDAEVKSGRPVDFDEFAAQWLAKASEGAA